MPTAPSSVEKSSFDINNENSSIRAEQLAFGFTNLCGSPYSGGSVVFSADGNCLFSPVSNRVVMTDLLTNRAMTAIPELRSAADVIAPMPFGNIILAIDVEGGRVGCAVFSQSGEYLAISVGRKIKVWKSASVDTNWQFVLLKTFVGHIGDVSCLSWTSFSNTELLVSGGSDSIVRVWSLNSEEVPNSILNDHSQSIIGAYFFDKSKSLVAINRAGAVIIWKREESVVEKSASREFSVIFRGSIPHGNGYVTAVSFDSFSEILLLGLSSGSFSLFDLKAAAATAETNGDSVNLQPLQSFSIGVSGISSVSLSHGGDWVAVGARDSGQLLVWEWKAENFIFKQQGHHDGVNCVAFCPVNVKGSTVNDLMEVFDSSSIVGASSGGLIATGGIEGKVKLWHSLSGFCFVTLADHTSSVEAVAFTPQGNAVVSASTDGSVRAYDLLRYKNFRTFTAPDARVQFGSLAIDPSGDIIAAGSANGNYSIYLWTTRTGQCIDILVGHEARISNIRFSPSADGLLASTSWDSSLRVWNVFAHKNKGGVAESLMNQREVSCCAFDPIDGSIVAVATISGHITFWDTKSGEEVGSIDGIRDIGTGRKDEDKFAPGALRGKKSKRDASGTELNLNQYFSSMSYGGASGRWLAAVSKNSVFVCIYDPLEKVLINRIELTVHAGLSGVKQFLNSKLDSEFATPDNYDELDRLGKQRKRTAMAVALPGIERGDFSGNGVLSRRVWRTNGLAVSSDGQELAVATSEGVFVLGLNRGVSGSGIGGSALSTEVTHGKVLAHLKTHQWTAALLVSLKLNEHTLVRKVYESIPVSIVSSVVSQIPSDLLLPLVHHLSLILHPIEGSKHVQKSVSWVLALLQLRFADIQKSLHGTDHSAGRELRAALCTILQHVQATTGAFGNLLRDNYFALGSLTTQTLETV